MDFSDKNSLWEPEYVLLFVNNIKNIMWTVNNSVFSLKYITKESNPEAHILKYFQFYSTEHTE